MVLRSLYEFYDRVVSDPDYNIAPTGFSYQKISFIVVLERDGRLSAIQDARTRRIETTSEAALSSGGARKPDRGWTRTLWDNAGIFWLQPKKPDRALRNLMLPKRHLDVEAQLCLDEYSMVCRFLESWDPADAIHYEVLTNLRGGFGVFQILGEPRYVHDHARIKEWWEANLVTDNEAAQGQCIITGQFAPLARLHPLIKGVEGPVERGRRPRAQIAAIVSYNL